MTIFLSILFAVSDCYSMTLNSLLLRWRNLAPLRYKTVALSMNDAGRNPARRQRRCASVTSPVPSLQSIRLPGIMDPDGRVDDSRLRKYIFKNGKKSFSTVIPIHGCACRYSILCRNYTQMCKLHVCLHDLVQQNCSVVRGIAVYSCLNYCINLPA